MTVGDVLPRLHKRLEFLRSQTERQQPSRIALTLQEVADLPYGTGAEAGCLSGTGLLRESAAAHEILETRVRSERIEAWSDQDARVEPLFVAFLEPTHRLIRIP